MKLELHLLQNFAPSNLNRDDTGAPKDCEFGGVRRARVSSQCIKRSIRQAFETHKLFGDETKDRLAARTKRLVGEVADLLADQGRDRETAFRLTAFAIGGAGLKMKDAKTQYLLFVPARMLPALSCIVDSHWDELLSAAPAVNEEKAPDPAATAPKGKAAAKSKKREKSEAKDSVPKGVATKVKDLFRDTSSTPDLALFGRMIADNADWNVDAACQVAHAISTHRTAIEFDFYTAVDDLKPQDAAGSDMMGTIAYQSACFYRYSCLDIDVLGKNLGCSDPEESKSLTCETLRAFLRAAVLAIPTGKQNSMAAQNLPSYMVAVLRRDGAPQSLANAFVKPVKASAERDLVESSADALEGYLAKSLGLWGDQGVEIVRCGDTASSMEVPMTASFSEWVDRVANVWGGCVSEDRTSQA